MPGKILIVYATRTGSTKGVAEYIGKVFGQLGEKADVMPVQAVTDLSGYKAVVVGSAIQGGKLLPEAVTFIENNRRELSQKPLAFFLVCMTLAMRKGNTYRPMVSGFLQPVRNIVTPVSEGLFAGILDIKKIPSWSDRLKFRLSVWFGVWKEGDHRDWQAIENWTKNLGFVANKKQE